MNEKVDLPNDQAVVPRQSSTKLYVMLGVLGVFVILLGLTFPAKAKLGNAQDEAEKLQNQGGRKSWPLETMKAIGRTPMVKESKDGELTQVYRWTGGVKVYELRVTFKRAGVKGVYDSPETIQAATKPFFMMESLDGFTTAHQATGSIYEELPDKDPLLITAAMVPSTFERPTVVKGIDLSDNQQRLWDKAVDELIEAQKKAYTVGAPLNTLMKGITAANVEFTEKVKGFLTPEQFADYDKEIKKRNTIDGGRTTEVPQGRSNR